MQPFLELLDGTSPAAKEFTLETTLLSLLLAFILGQALAWVYYLTHSGLSYSRAFVQSLILITVVVSMVMSAIANSFVTAVGLMGALAIVRFRNPIKDTRDISFIFSALVAGMTCGAQRYSTAIIGTTVLIAVIFYLHLTNFGAHQPLNGFLQFRLIGGRAHESPVLKVLNQYCRTLTMVSVRESENDGSASYAYQLMLSDPAQNEEMLASLKAVPGVNGINLTVQEPLLEV